MKVSAHLLNNVKKTRKNPGFFELVRSGLLRAKNLMVCMLSIFLDCRNEQRLGSIHTLAAQPKMNHHPSK